eukprot:366097-Chlamydomonas_euryale.AAC.14
MHGRDASKTSVHVHGHTGRTCTLRGCPCWVVNAMQATAGAQNEAHPSMRVHKSAMSHKPTHRTLIHNE